MPKPSVTLRYMLAAIVVVGAIGIAEAYDMRIAWLFALATLAALFLSNPSTVAQLRAAFGV